jgi:Mlc titration factor MtfA (ptsG expression regulator)
LKSSSVAAALLATVSAAVAWLALRHRRRELKRARQLPLAPQWRQWLMADVALYRRLPADLRLRIEPVTQQLLSQWRFVGCDALEVTDRMRVVIAAQAALLVVEHGALLYDDLKLILLYPDEFVIPEVQEDELGLVTEMERPASGQAIETDRIVLSWRDVIAPGDTAGPYNVVLHEFAHYLDHATHGDLSQQRSAASSHYHELLSREYQRLCDTVARDQPTLIDPYGVEDPAEFFAVATEAFFESPHELRAQHVELYDALRSVYRLDPASWDPT